MYSVRETGDENAMLEKMILGSLADADINSPTVQSELKKFIGRILRRPDGDLTHFARTYDLKDGKDVYALFGVILDSLNNGDYQMSLRLLKGLTGTICLSADTEGPAGASESFSMLTALDTIRHIFDMAELVLVKHADLMDTFYIYADKESLNDESPDQESAIEGFNKKNDIFCGGVSMDTEKLISLIRENFDTNEEINEGNVLDAIESIIKDFISLNETHEQLQKQYAAALETLEKFKRKYPAPSRL